MWSTLSRHEFFAWLSTGWTSEFAALLPRAIGIIQPRWPHLESSLRHRETERSWRDCVSTVMPGCSDTLGKHSNVQRPNHQDSKISQKRKGRQSSELRCSIIPNIGGSRTVHCKVPPTSKHFLARR